MLVDELAKVRAGCGTGVIVVVVCSHITLRRTYRIINDIGVESPVFNPMYGQLK